MILFFVLPLLLTVSTSQHIIDSGQSEVDTLVNDTPIIGILTQEISYRLNTKWPGVYTSYIAASYIKFVEGAGARPVPLWIGKPRDYYASMMNKLNGVLLPGGSTWFNQTGGYAEAGNHIYEIAAQMNDEGNHMPVFGTCLGFELLLYISAGNREYRASCESLKQALPLDFTEDFRRSRMFGSAPDEIVEILKNEPVTANFHTFCLTEKNVSAFHFDRDWKILSYGRDINGLRFVSSIEHKKYPFYGVQFHPEKNLYEWIRNRNIPHTENAIKMAQYFARFFVHETRKNVNQFAGIDEENRMLIYNFPVTFTALVNSSFEQSYLFTDAVQYGNGSIVTCNNCSCRSGSISMLDTRFKYSCALILLLIKTLIAFIREF